MSECVCGCVCDRLRWWGEIKVLVMVSKVDESDMPFKTCFFYSQTSIEIVKANRRNSGPPNTCLVSTAAASSPAWTKQQSVGH